MDNGSVACAVQWLNGRCIVTVRPEYVERCKPGWLAELQPPDVLGSYEQLEARLKVARSARCILVVDWLGLNRYDAPEEEVERRYQAMRPLLHWWRAAGGLSLHSTGAAPDIAARLLCDGFNGSVA